jgi:hypothetical protein
MTSKRKMQEIVGLTEPASLEDRIRAGFLALEDADELFAERLVALAKDVYTLRRDRSNAEFGRVWAEAGFRYHGRALNKNEREKLVDIARYASAHPDKVVRDIAESHSRSIERIGQKLALPPPPQPLPPGWRFDATDGRCCFTLTGVRSEISIVVVRDGDDTREWWHWGFGWIDGDEDIEQGEADDRQTAMRDAEAAARRVMDADDKAFLTDEEAKSSSEPSEDGGAAPQPQPTQGAGTAKPTDQPSETQDITDAIEPTEEVDIDGLWSAFESAIDDLLRAGVRK